LRDAVRSAIRQSLFTPSQASIPHQPASFDEVEAVPARDGACGARISVATRVRGAGTRGTHASAILLGGESASSGASPGSRARRSDRTASQQAPVPSHREWTYKPEHIRTNERGPVLAVRATHVWRADGVRRTVEQIREHEAWYTADTSAGVGRV
jgi:hypothetical protein